MTNKGFLKLNKSTFNLRFKILQNLNLRIIFQLLIFLFLSNIIFAQIPDSTNKKSDLKNSIGVSLGLSDFHVRDEMASPLTYRGTGITGCLEYKRKGEKSIHTAGLSGYYDILTTNFAKYDAENYRVGFRYNYLHRISELSIFKNNFKIYVGGGVYSFLNYSHYKEYISKIELINVPWYWSHSAEFSFLFDYFISHSNHVTLQFYLPIISNVSRPAYSSFGRELNRVGVVKLFGVMAPFWKNPNVQINVGFNYRINTWLKIFAQYNFQYASYSEPRKVAMYMNNLRTGTKFLF